jgi:uncharacterized protein (DUF924 family)
MDERIEAILEFWFGTPAESEERPVGRELWLEKSFKVDRLIEKRFGRLVKDALASKLDGWAETARGRLALILLLDEFPRHVYRETREAFSGEEKALGLCFDGLDEDMHRELDAYERAFFLMPCLHAEDSDAQLAGVEEFQELVAEAPPEKRELCEEFLRLAEQNRDIVERFERFPQRNNILDRQSTSEESAFLQHSGSL